MHRFEVTQRMLNNLEKSDSVQQLVIYAIHRTKFFFLKMSTKEDSTKKFSDEQHPKSACKIPS